MSYIDMVSHFHGLRCSGIASTRCFNSLDPRYGVGYTLTIAKLPHVTVHQPSGMSKKHISTDGNMMGIWLIYIDL